MVSWKAIARFLGCSERTARRWEEHEGLPVHRHQHQSQATIYAYPVELEQWRTRHEQSVSVAAPANRAEQSGSPFVVVLPFGFVGADGSESWVADGFTEEVIARLSGIGSLRVISRTSAMALKQGNHDVHSIRRRLGVSHVLEGTVRAHKNSLRISVRLVDAASDDRAWSQQYNGDMDDVFHIQEQIAREIVRALKVTLVGNEADQLGQSSVTDLTTWRRLLLAHQQAFRWQQSSIDEAVSLLQDGLKDDPGEVLLHTALGRTILHYREAGIDTTDHPLEEAKSCLERAARIDSGHASVRQLRGWIHFAEGHIAEAIVALQSALAIEPNDPDCLTLLANCLCIHGMQAMAGPYIDRVLEIDPLTPINHCLPGWVDSLDGDFRSAELAYRKMLEMDSGNPVARLFYVWILAANDRFEEAAEVTAAYPEPLVSSLPARIARCFVSKDAFLDLSPEAERIAEQAEMLSRLIAEAAAFHGDEALAARWLQQALSCGFGNRAYLERHSPFFRNVRESGQVQKIIQSLPLN